MGLRLREGIDVRRLQEIGGREVVPSRLQALAAQGLIEISGDRLAATESGRVVLDRLILELAA
jgi:oxygen-independent coproporphyrinogen-3 oxidase